MEKVYSQIKNYVDDNKDEMIKLWEKLVNTESGPVQKEGVDKICEILKKEMEEVGAKTNIIEMEKAGNILVGTWNTKSEKQPIVFIGHMDTVFKPGITATNPFRIDENGKAYGPGVLDMKGGLVIAVYAVKALASVGYSDRPVKFVFAGDEEVLHQDTNAREVMSDEIRGAFVALNFETGYPDDGLVVGRKGGGAVNINIKGVQVHSGIEPENGRSAVLEAAHKIKLLESKNDIARGKLINCGQVIGGLGPNTVAGECNIVVGIRFPTIAIRDEIMNELNEVVSNTEVADTTATMSIGGFMDCMEPTEDVMKLFTKVQKIAKDCGYGDVHSFETGGVSDSAVAVVAGVPTVCALGVKGVGNHTVDEWADVQSLFERCALAAIITYSIDLY